jgi:hypothetical protein
MYRQADRWTGCTAKLDNYTYQNCCVTGGGHISGDITLSYLLYLYHIEGSIGITGTKLEGMWHLMSHVEWEWGH